MARTTFRNKITSDELTKQINPENIRLMNKFLKEKSRGTSDKTIIVYESNLTIFFTWNLLHNDNKLFTDIKKLEFSDFFTFASDEMKVGSSKQNNMRSTLSSMSAFIEKFYDEDYPNFRNVILRVVDSAPKEVRREKTILTDEQVEELLNYLSVSDKQQACWLALAVTCGARFSELLNFEYDLIDENRTAFGDLFLETTRQIKTKGRGKAGKLLYKYILKDKFLPYYKEWMEERAKILENKEISHKFLFVKPDGSPMTSAVIKGWVASYEKRLKTPFYTHSVRHYLTTLLSRKHIPEPLIKELMGWESVVMVATYDDSSAKDRVYKELDNLKL